MQIRRTFLLTLALCLASSGSVFGYALGPISGVNGIFGNVAQQTCAQAGCHSGNPLNVTGGSVTISGLPPSGWVAGQTYPLTITVQRTNVRTYGFQLSSVIDANTQQAGTLTAGSGQHVICGTSNGVDLNSCNPAGAIQFAEHSFPASGTTGVFAVSWTAPASASAGTVRFNVAGNAANGDGNNTGDFIYTNVYKVAPAAAVDLSTRAFTMVDRGGVSLITDGSGDLSVGYSRIQPAGGSTTPAGVAIFGFRVGSPPNTTLVSETGVPATPALTSGRIYAEVAGAVDTGLAIANPNGSSATINFFFTDASGNPAGSGSTTILPNQQIAQFLDQSTPAPFNVYGTPTFQGTFSFTSSLPVAVIALRGFTNERGEFLMSTLPVIDTTLPPNNGTVVVPHFADGGGWTTQIFLINPTDNPMTGSVLFTNPSGVATNVTIGAQTGSSFNYSVPKRTSQKLVTAGAGSVTASGSVRIVPGGGGASPTPLIVFSYKPAGFTVSEAGVPVTSGTAFRLYVESSGSIQTGIAVANTSSSGTPVTFEVTDLNGAPVSGIVPFSVTLSGLGQTAKFLNELFPTLPSSFKGVLRITATSSVISVVGLRTRTNERGDFLITTTPPSNENAAPTSTESLFPHLVNGGGYTTQFILFSGITGQAASGNLKFLKQDGTAFSLTVN